MRDCGNSACSGLREGAVVDRLGCSYSGTQPETADADKTTSKDPIVASPTRRVKIVACISYKVEHEERRK